MNRVAALTALACCSGCCLIPDLNDLIPDASYLEGPTGLSNISAFFDGGTTRFGETTVTVTFDAGVEIMTTSYGNKPPFDTVIFPDDNHTYETADFDLDGTPDYYDEVTDDGGFVTEVIERGFTTSGEATDIDTRTFDRSNGLPYAETDVRVQLKNGIWTELWNYSGPASAEDVTNGPNCSGDFDPSMGGFPTSFDTYSKFSNDFPPPPTSGVTYVQVLNTNVIILQGDPSQGYCDKTHATYLNTAFSLAINTYAATCLPTYNTEMNNAFVKGLAQPLFVACSDQCGDSLAASDLPAGSIAHASSYRFGKRAALGEVQRMVFNPTLIDSMKANGWKNIGEDLSEVALHELMHFVGFPHTPPGSEGCPTGIDPVYGMARYCSQCPSKPMTVGSQSGSISDAARDCANGADNTFRVLCGVTLDITDDAPPTVATGSQNILTCSCDTSHWAYAKSCDAKDIYGDACNGYHEFPDLDAGDPGGECCESSSGDPACVPDPGCTDGWGDWSQLSTVPVPPGSDCYSFPIGVMCMGFRLP